MNDTYRVCKSTVLDTSYPGITFNEEGVCNLVADFHEAVEPHWHAGPEGRRQLEATVEEIKLAGKLDPEAFKPFTDTISGSRWKGTQGGPLRT